MINRELIDVFSEIAREKNVERSELASILEDLFLYVIEKEYGDASNCSCIVNLDKGEIEIYAEKTIVEEIDDQKIEITLSEAIEKEPKAAEDLEIGEKKTVDMMSEEDNEGIRLMSLKEAEKLLIKKALIHTSENRTQAAKILGVSIRTLRNKINEYRNNGNAFFVNLRWNEVKNDQFRRANASSFGDFFKF